MADIDHITVATIGKAVGVRGEAKLHLDSDFPEQFVKGAVFRTPRGEVTIERYEAARGIVKFLGINSPDDLAPYVTQPLETTVEETKRRCRLGKGEYFWFDIIGLSVVEEGELLGTVSEIERYAGTDMLLVQTAASLIALKAPKSFLVPYTDRYILHVDQGARSITVRYAKDILEAS